MGDTPVQEVLQSSKKVGDIDLDTISLEALVLLINTERLRTLEGSTEKELKELTARQKIVSDLHNTLSAINDATDSKGKLTIKKDSDLYKMLKEAKKMGVKISKKEGSFDSNERERLVENIRMHIEDLNVKNDMQLQKVTRLTNERYESYQMARSILKPLDEDKKNKARAVSGR
ncbi:MAG: hypothetical protein H7A37_05150 [Chlamydiales bacterium]|nr:hypothetical protein [Chlamydiales bacterium]